MTFANTRFMNLMMMFNFRRRIARMSLKKTGLPMTSAVIESDALQE